MRRDHPCYGCATPSQQEPWTCPQTGLRLQVEHCNRARSMRAADFKAIVKDIKSRAIRETI